MMLKIVLSALLLTTSVFAAEEAKKADPVFQQPGYNFVGLSLGIAKPAGTNVNQIPLRIGYGFEVSHAFMKDLAVGFYASRNDGEVARGSSVDLTITRIAAQVTYSPTYDSFLNLRAGLGFLDATLKTGNVVIKNSTTPKPFFVAPGFGMVFPIADRIQFIPSLHYSFFFENSDVQDFQVLDVAATIRYQF